MVMSEKRGNPSTPERRLFNGLILHEYPDPSVWSHRRRIKVLELLGSLARGRHDNSGGIHSLGKPGVDVEDEKLRKETKWE